PCPENDRRQFALAGGGFAAGAYRVARRADRTAAGGGFGETLNLSPPGKTMMNAGNRYENLRSALVREEPLVTVPRDWDELELQAHWFAGDFGREFATTTGRAVRIVQFGVWNREA